MKTSIKYIGFLATAAILFASCENNVSSEDNATAQDDDDHHEDEVHLTDNQFEIMGMRVDTMTTRMMGSYVQTNGELEVPPQNEASVTAIMGANIISIKVIEGDKVKKGQTLATLSHPNLIKLQTDYISKFHELDYLEQDYDRQSRLFEENVGSGREFQKIKAEYLSTKGLVKGYEAQLRQMGLSTPRLQNGEVYDEIPVASPIDGNVRLVNVKIGQFVQPETELFSLVNIDHIHADFMVFEKDIDKVKEGQEIRFRIESAPDNELRARIFSVGTAFEQDPKAVHIHADIEGEKGNLLPGMYVRGRIYSEQTKVTALPDAAVVREGNSYYIFTAERIEDEENSEWHFDPVEVKIGKSDDGWKEIKFLNPIAEKTLVAWNNAYYLYSEMKKHEADHAH